MTHLTGKRGEQTKMYIMLLRLMRKRYLLEMRRVVDHSLDLLLLLLEQLLSHNNLDLHRAAMKHDLVNELIQLIVV